MGQEDSTLASPTLSTFVTVVAWIFIAIAGFATFLSVLQALMFTFVFPTEQMVPPAGTSKELEQLPAFFRFMIENIEWFFVAFWSLCVVTLVAAIGLLRRKNWARLVFILIMAFGIVWNLGGIWLQKQMMSSFPKLPTHSPPEFEAQFETMMTVMSYAMDVFAIAISLLFAWIIKRLISRSVKAEFNAL